MRSLGGTGVRARPAQSLSAPKLGSGESKGGARHPKQPSVGRDFDGMRVAIYGIRNWIHGPRDSGLNVKKLYFRRDANAIRESLRAPLGRIRVNVLVTLPMRVRAAVHSSLTMALRQPI